METDVCICIKECFLFIFLLIITVLKVFYLTFKNVILVVFPTRTKNIADDIILITGGGRGIGRQIALKIAAHNPKHIILWGRKEVPLKQTAEDVFNAGVPCSVYICDVCNRDSIYQRYEDIKTNIGDVTILINNAGVFNGGLIVDDTEDNIKKTFAINTLAHIWTYKAFLPGMISQGRGHIVTMSSMLGKMPLRGASSYCSSKYGTTGLSEALELELQEYPSINLTSVHPYQVANEMFRGLKLRFPWMIPPLSEEDVAKATVNAVLTNKKIVLMPAIMHILVPCLSLFPINAMAPVNKFLGVDSALNKIITQKKE